MYLSTSKINGQKNIGYSHNSVDNIPKFDLDRSKNPDTVIQNRKNRSGNKLLGMSLCSPSVFLVLNLFHST